MNQEQFETAVEFLKKGRVKQLLRDQKTIYGDPVNDNELRGYGTCLRDMFGKEEWMRVIEEADERAEEAVASA